MSYDVQKFYGVASETSNLVSEASKPSAGASWQRPAIGRPTSASISNCAKFCSSAQLQILF